MDSTFTIEVTNKKAIELLRKLEELNLIRFLNNEKKQKNTISERLRGSISEKEAIEFEKHIKAIRDEW